MVPSSETPKWKSVKGWKDIYNGNRIRELNKFKNKEVRKWFVNCDLCCLSLRCFHLIDNCRFPAVIETDH